MSIANAVLYRKMHTTLLTSSNALKIRCGTRLAHLSLPHWGRYRLLVSCQYLSLLAYDGNILRLLAFIFRRFRKLFGNVRVDPGHF